MQTHLQLPQRLFAQPVRYEIPAFQRPYVWKQEEQWEPLWDDVEELARTIMEGETEPEPHFLGAVVLQQMQTPAASIERRRVVDGQQRLTTLQLLVDAIHKVLFSQAHEKPAKRLQRLVANEEEFCGNEPDYRFKVWPTIGDRDAFRNTMSTDSVGTGLNSGSLIVRAHDYFMRKTQQWLGQFEESDVERAADALDRAVRVCLQFVVIDLGEADDPHVIFETLNARGTPLRQSDMVKNKVLYEVGVGHSDDTAAQAKVEDIWPFNDEWWYGEVGRGSQRRPRIDVYINHWLTLRSPDVTRLYDEFRSFEKYLDDKDVNDVADDMRNLSFVYTDVEKVQRTDIATFLRRRKIMNVGVIVPLLLWLLSGNLSPSRLKNSLKAVESFLVRRMVCGYSSRSYGDLFIGLIKRLDTLSTHDDADRVIVDHLRAQTAQATYWPDDKELLNRFFTAPLYRILTRGRLLMVLAGIEAELRRTSKAGTDQAPANLQIEHVMPQKWHANWPLHDGSDMEAGEKRDLIIHTMGNLTLVNRGLNSTLSNAPWSQKRKLLGQHSVLHLNKRLLDEAGDCWDEQAISVRGEALFTQAVKIWPYADAIG